MGLTWLVVNLGYTFAREQFSKFDDCLFVSSTLRVTLDINDDFPVVSNIRRGDPLNAILRELGSVGCHFFCRSPFCKEFTIFNSGDFEFNAKWTLLSLMDIGHCPGWKNFY